MNDKRRQTIVPLTAGVLVADRYRVDRRIGSGAVGEVWAGEHLGLGLPVAIKTLAAVHAGSREMIARFRREATLLARIRSDSVARALDYIEDDHHGQLLVMELLAGESLSDVLERQTLSVQEAISLGLDLAEALGHLHRAHLVHRDLKPGNVILERGGRRRAVLVDFGASRMLSRETPHEDGEDTLTAITRADIAIGTMEYMAPEQMLSARDVTAACDCYALGAMLYRAVAGRHVYGKLSEGKLVRAKLLEDAPPLVTGETGAVARGLEELVARCLRRQPEDRYSDAGALAGDLETLLALAKRPALDAPESRGPDTEDDGQAPFELIPLTPEPLSQEALETQPPPPPTTITVAPPRRPSRRARAAVSLAIVATVGALALPATLVVGSRLAPAAGGAVPAWLEARLPDTIILELPPAPAAAATVQAEEPPKPKKLAPKPRPVSPPRPPAPAASPEAPAPAAPVAEREAPPIDQGVD